MNTNLNGRGVIRMHYSVFDAFFLKRFNYLIRNTNLSLLHWRPSSPVPTIDKGISSDEFVLDFKVLNTLNAEFGQKVVPD